MKVEVKSHVKVTNKEQVEEQSTAKWLLACLAKARMLDNQVEINNVGQSKTRS